MALDLGKKRIGVAMTDEAGLMAHPLTMVKAGTRAKTMEDILALIKEHQPAEVVVGLPINMDGSLGSEAEKCRDFAERLQGEASLPVHLWDERLTTVMAERSLIESGVRRQRRRMVVDIAAAVLLLQDFLQARRHSK